MYVINFLFCKTKKMNITQHFLQLLLFPTLEGKWILISAFLDFNDAAGGKILVANVLVMRGHRSLGVDVGVFHILNCTSYCSFLWVVLLICWVSGLLIWSTDASADCRRGHWIVYIGPFHRHDSAHTNYGILVPSGAHVLGYSGRLIASATCELTLCVYVCACVG